jgi:tRNA pseudouridine55 synthase
VVEVPSRMVDIKQIQILAWYPGEFPELDVMIICGTGTYIRAIARDLGRMLEVGGTLAALTRTQSCSLHLEESLSLEQIEYQIQEDIFNLIEPDNLLSHLPQIQLDFSLAKRWCQGQKINLENDFASSVLVSEKALESGTIIRVYNEDGEFLGVSQYNYLGTEALFVPKIVLNRE